MLARRELAEVTKGAQWASYVDVGMTALERTRQEHASGA